MDETPKPDSDSTGNHFPEQLTGVNGSEAIVIQWLDRLGFKHTPLEIEGYPWVLQVTDPVDDVFLVGWQDEWGALQVQANLELDEAHQQAYLLMSAADKATFLSSIGADLGRMALDHAIIPKATDEDEPAPTPMNSPPASVIIIDTLLVDRSRYCSDFFSLYLRVRGALRLVRHMFGNMALLRQWRP